MGIRGSFIKINIELYFQREYIDIVNYAYRL